MLQRNAVVTKMLEPTSLVKIESSLAKLSNCFQTNKNKKRYFSIRISVKSFKISTQQAMLLNGFVLWFKFCQFWAFLQKICIFFFLKKRNCSIILKQVLLSLFPQAPVTRDISNASCW